MALWWLVACVDVRELDDTSGDAADTDLDSGAPDSAADTAGDTAGDVDTADTGEAPLTVLVNELMPENEGAWAGPRYDHPDWIELFNAGTEAVDLRGWSITDDQTEPDKHVFEEETILGPGAFLLLIADDETDLGADHLDFTLAGSGGEVGLFAPDGRGSVVAYGNVADDFSVARVTDGCQGDGCWTFDFQGTPGTTNTPPVELDVDLLPRGSTWSYWNLGYAPSDSWNQPDFDASVWPTGAGPLGYGDSHIVTSISIGPDGARYPTIYFRADVELSGVSGLLSATIELNRDDGAAVYVNGVEVARTNLTLDTLTYDTYASSAASASDETSYFSYELDPTLLVDGTNTIAVEVHQASAGSSDLSFDLAMSGTVLGQ